MSTHDTQGRPWAKLSELKPGDHVEIDSGMTCMDAGCIREVMKDNLGLFVVCNEGTHHLIGQTGDGEHLVGMYHVR